MRPRFYVATRKRHFNPHLVILVAPSAKAFYLDENGPIKRDGARRSAEEGRLAAN